MRYARGRVLWGATQNSTTQGEFKSAKGQEQTSTLSRYTPALPYRTELRTTKKLSEQVTRSHFLKKRFQPALVTPRHDAVADVIF